MNWQRAVDLKQDELSALKRGQSLAELRAKVADLPRGRALGPVMPDVASVYRPSPVPGSRLVVPSELPLVDASGASPYSLEALIAAELNAQTLARAHRPPRVLLVPELKRRGVPTSDPLVEMHTLTPVVDAYAAVLRLQPAAAVVWTDRAWYGGQAEDLRGLVDWAWERRDEQTPPVWIRGELILDPWQVYETRVLGGDGVVLEPAPLSDMQLEDVLGTALEVGIDVLVYVTRLEEAERAVEQGIVRLAVGAGPLLESASRRVGGRGPLRELLADLPRDVRAVSWGGCGDLDELDTRALTGVHAVVVGRQYLSLYTAQAARPS